MELHRTELFWLITPITSALHVHLYQIRIAVCWVCRAFRLKSDKKKARLMKTWNFQGNVQVKTVTKCWKFFCCTHCTYYWKLSGKDSESGLNLNSAKVLFCLHVTLCVSEVSFSVTMKYVHYFETRPLPQNIVNIGLRRTCHRCEQSWLNVTK